MDFDSSKENIQPLRGGRNVHQLEMALQAQSNREYQLELLQQKEEFENLIRNYTGDDPLETYYNYISWVEQSYPKHGHEGNLIPLLEHCLGLFENDKRYTNDRRFCKLWIKYFDLQPNPLELYHMMRARGLCCGCADFYKAWAYYYEAAGDFQSANNVFEDGKRALAQPYEDLENAHQNLIMTTGQHALFGPDENRLMEKRQALTSLRTYRSGRVGSIRVPTKDGTTTLPFNGVTARSNVSVFVYEDRSEQAAAGVAEAAPQSIIAVARRQEAPKENTLKPGPWTTMPVKKRVVAAKTNPGFTVLEDVDIPEGIKLPSDHPKESLEDYSQWTISIRYPEPPNPKTIPMYPKDRVYMDPNTEYSIEELRACRYLENVSNRQGVEQLERCQAVGLVSEDVEVMQESKDEQTEKKLENDTHCLQNSLQHCTKQDTVVLQFPNQQDSIKLDAVEESVPPKFSIWSNSPSPKKFDVSSPPKLPSTSKFFAVYEQSPHDTQPSTKPKGSSMKTVFKDLKAEELAKSGLRCGMDIADTSQAMESAKASANQDRDLEVTCDTQMFNFNLNEMKVSTPQNERTRTANIGKEAGCTREQLFMERMEQQENKGLSTIFEETKSSGFSSSSSGAVTKSPILSSHNGKMDTVSSEEHNNYLA